MQIYLNINRSTDEIFSFVLTKLPMFIKNSLESFVKEKGVSTVDEIRIHSNSYITLISRQNNIVTDTYVEKGLLEEIFIELCQGSVYAYVDTIKDGYISIGKGIRAGICGKAIMENGTLMGVNDITSICIRLPHRISFAGAYVYGILKRSSFLSSILLYSAPGVGKTTILRDLAYRLSNTNPPVRFAIVDTKEEITPFLNEINNANIYLSYPKGIAIELATKCMTPELILCDEISSKDEAISVSQAINCGVTLVATTHAKSFEELKTKEILKPLFSANAFDLAIGVVRSNSNKFEYTVDKLK